MTSNSGLIGAIGQANYAAAKMGLNALSKCMAMEMQSFGVRANELFVYCQPRPVRSVQRAQGGTAQRLHEHGMPALRRNFVPMDTMGDLFPWAPI